MVRAVVRAVCRMWEGTLQWARENCPELLYRLQLAAEREAEAEQEARASFWRLWKTPYERVKRVRPANQRDDVQWC